MKLSSYLQTAFVLIASVFFFASTSQACDYASLVLNDVQDAGQGKYNITVTYTAGAGYSGSGYGAAQNTWTYAFFLSGDAIVTNYPATIVSPNTGATFAGFTVQEDTVLAYHNPYEWWACIYATCGPVQPIAYTLTFQTFGLPDEIRLVGMEGAGNPAAGCNDADMVVSLDCHPLSVDAGNETTVYYGYAPAECATLTASASGGSGSYTYTWDTEESGASISACPQQYAHYFVTVTDNVSGCTTIDYVKVNYEDIRCGTNKVLMCKNGQTRCVNNNQVPGKLNSGWVLGACSGKSGVTDEVIGITSDLSLEAGPNPFCETTTLRVSVPVTEEMSLRIYNINGALVKTLHEGALEAGERSFTLSSEGLSPGAYIARLVTGQGEMVTKKLMIQ